MLKIDMTNSNADRLPATSPSLLTVLNGLPTIEALYKVFDHVDYLCIGGQAMDNLGISCGS
jgi:hypothetical protein